MLLGSIIFACFTRIVSLVYAWYMRGVLDRAIYENVGEMTAAAELHMALLRQRGFVPSYLIDTGNQEWLHQLEREESSFRKAFDKMSKATRAGNELAILPEVLDAYDAYDGFRKVAVSLQKHGNADEAKALYLNQINRSYQKTSSLVDEIVTINREKLQNTLSSAEK